MSFAQLHPSIQHHVVNTLQWRELRPLQVQAVDPILRGEDLLLLAPTAGGKTEAALLPLLSRILTEEWQGPSVLWICPIKALLNNLHLRIESFAALVGRRAAVWHGDIAAGEKTRILRERPDLLLTTPESLEVLLSVRRAEETGWLAGLRVVVIDEIHAFGRDDRGWHLLFLLDRLTAGHKRRIQRIGLSATVGAPEALLEWFRGPGEHLSRIVRPEATSAPEAEIEVDYVGTLENAAKVLAQLYRGEKRLVFCDSKSNVESLAAALHEAGVETFVSHGSLGLDERRRAETAFAQARNCVIVATSTLEMGLDVGDLDRVIQIDAPATVASWLQRLGRTGRRPGTQRSGLILATNPMDLAASLGLLILVDEGYVEPVEAPPWPLHVVLQQILALIAETGARAPVEIIERLQRTAARAGLADDLMPLLERSVAEGVLALDGNLLIWGPVAEERFKGQRGLDLFAVFESSRLIQVRHGRFELGSVDNLSFAAQGDGPVVLLLGGRPWRVREVDWKDRVAFVEPLESAGRSIWLSTNNGRSFPMTRALRSVLLGRTPHTKLSRRAATALDELRIQMKFLASEGTSLQDLSDGRRLWWTFAGKRANATLAALLKEEGVEHPAFDDEKINWRRGAGMVAPELNFPRWCDVPADQLPLVFDRRAGITIKFHEILAQNDVDALLRRRLLDPMAVQTVLRERATHLGLPEKPGPECFDPCT